MRQPDCISNVYRSWRRHTEKGVVWGRARCTVGRVRKDFDPSRGQMAITHGPSVDLIEMIDHHEASVS